MNINAIPIAITGMAFKFPAGLESEDSFWETLASARSAWSTFPSSRLNFEGVYDADEERLNSFPIRGAHFVDGDVGAFDAPFFTIGPAEAAEIDPQSRILLETTYHALENAGIPMSSIAGTRTSVHTGSFGEDYKGHFILDPQFAGKYAASSLSPNMIANRISWFFDLRGESVNLDTACSSTLVAMHAACQGLRTGSADVAIVAGANLFLSPDTATFLNNQGFLSPSGRCWSFDEKGDGYGRGEGFGAIILKRADEAIHDRDPIRAVVRASGTNQDGHTTGIVQPDQDAQSRLIQETYEKAGIDMGNTRYVEAHGTGTKVGDPIEAAAIAEAFKDHITDETPLYVGSVKSNIGHLEGTSGIAGVVKSVLMLDREMIPGIAGLETLNKTIEKEQPMLRFPKEPNAWPADGVRRVSINSFGFGGTNAHVVLEDASSFLKSRGVVQNNRHASASVDPKLLVFSSQDEDGIARLETAYNEHLSSVASNPQRCDLNVEELAYTLSERRSSLLWRSFRLCTDPDDLRGGCKLSSPVKALSSPRLALCFTGQGAQWHAMGRELAIYDCYSASLTACADDIRSFGSEWDLHDELTRDEGESRVDEPEVSQALCTALQIALVDLLEHFGLHATVVVGHSSGEIAAAYCIGALDRHSAMRIAYHRGRLASRLARDNRYTGAMFSVGLRVEAELGPSNVTVTGEGLHIDWLEEYLNERGIFNKRLAVGVAYHSKHMQLIAEEASIMELGKAEYWVKNLVSPVQFAKASRIQFDDILEIGPHGALQRPIRDTLATISSRRELPGYVSALTRNVNGHKSLLSALGYLHINQIQHLEVSCLANLPKYPFNHTQSYWREPRMGKGHRFRQAPRNDFLGIRVPDWNPRQAKWRRRFKLSEDPWLADHVIAGANILPGAMAVVMAIEAVKNVQFFRAITLSPDPDGIEPQRRLFQLYALENDSWVEACCGKISIRNADNDKGKVDAGLETQRESQRHAVELARLQSSCSREVNMARMYTALAEKGVNYGPTFQPILTCMYNDNYECHADINAQSWRAKRRKFHRSDFSIHPTCLDGLFHLNVVPMTDGGRRILPSVVAGIRKLYVSEKIKGKESLLAWNKSFFAGRSNVLSEVVALDAGHEESLVVMSGLEARYLREESAPETLNKRLCWNFDSRPDIDLLTNDEVYQYLVKQLPMQLPPSRMDRDITLLVHTSILRTLRSLSPDDILDLTPYHQKYMLWMQRETEKLGDDSKIGIRRELAAYLDDDTLYAQLIETIEKRNKRGAFFAAVARNLSSILKGEVDAVELLFSSPLLKEYYQEVHEESNARSQAMKYLDLHAHKNPRMKILELGAGTGGMTRHILDTLTVNGSGEAGAGPPRFEHYTYTDISAGFFPGAGSLFERFPDKVTFQVLDIEKDPLPQGFEGEAYDIVIADNVFHATQNLDNAANNARKLLKPGGKLILFELVSPDVSRLNFGFGVLPGWWRFEDQYRELSAGVDLSSWDSVLRQASFSGVDVDIKDFEEQTSREHSALISTAVSSIAPEKQSQLPRAAVVYDVLDSMQNQFAKELLAAMTNLGIPETHAVSLETAAQLAANGNWFFVIIIELGDSFIMTLNEVKYALFQGILQSADGILWVSRGGGARPQLPDYAMIQGAFRGIRLEEQGSKFISLSLESTSLNLACILDLTMRVFRAVANTPVNGCEQEYVERDGYLCVDRLIEADYINQQLPSLMTEMEESESSFAEHSSLRLEISTPGLLDTLQFVEDEMAEKPLSPDEITIKVEACGVNFRDCLIALGRIPGDRFGFECAGTVSRLGHGVVGLDIGDRVCASTVGTYQTFARCKTADIIPVPAGMSFTEAAALPIVFSTAYYALVHVANIQPGESILIHSAAGGTGQAAIQIAKLYGAIIFGTVGSEDKKELLMDLYSIPAENILDSRNSSFASGIHRITNGKGVDVVLNSLSDSLLVSSWECIAPFGRFLELGKKDILSNGDLPMRMFERNASFHAIDLNEARRYKPDLLQQLQREISTLIAKRQITPPQPIHVYGVGEIEQAFRYLQSGRNTGKTIVEMRPTEMVKTKLKIQRPWQFDPGVTYVIAGGLGGIGRATALWMAGRGAQNLLLLSRSKVPNEEAQEAINTLRKRGVRVEVRSCDISDYNSLQSVIHALKTEMPPIKGCIQSAMVLRNKVFGNMAYADWKAAVDCKVSGTWNLHSLLPSDMSFFIMYSSIFGAIGGTAGANYSAACAYQDALAHYRNGIGQPATTLNLGVMLDDGVLRDNEAVRNALMGSGYPIGISQREMFALLEYHCDPSRGIPQTPLKSQVLVGLNTPRALSAQGHEVPVLLSRPLFRATWNIVDTSATQAGSEGTEDVLRNLGEVKSMQDAADVIAECLMQRLSKSLGVPLKNLDVGKPMNQYGVDSLVAVELRNWFKWKLDADIAVFGLLGKMSFEDVGRVAAEKSVVVQKFLGR
ncbi:hypothetical protein BDV18DRAFT_165373 [Aspergillus unguis]